MFASKGGREERKKERKKERRKWNEETSSVAPRGGNEPPQPPPERGALPSVVATGWDGAAGVGEALLPTLEGVDWGACPASPAL